MINVFLSYLDLVLRSRSTCGHCYTYNTPKSACGVNFACGQFLCNVANRYANLHVGMEAVELYSLGILLQGRWPCAPLITTFINRLEHNIYMYS